MNCAKRKNYNFNWLKQLFFIKHSCSCMIFFFGDIGTLYAISAQSSLSFIQQPWRVLNKDSIIVSSLETPGHLRFSTPANCSEMHTLSFQNFLSLGFKKSQEHFWAILSVTYIPEIIMNSIFYIILLIIYNELFLENTFTMF